MNVLEKILYYINVLCLHAISVRAFIVFIKWVVLIISEGYIVILYPLN